MNKVEKMGAILLMKSNFNFLNKLLFGFNIIKMAEKAKVIPMYRFHSAMKAGNNKNMLFGLITMIIWDTYIVSSYAHTYYKVK